MGCKWEHSFVVNSATYICRVSLYCLNSSWAAISYGQSMNAFSTDNSFVKYAQEQCNRRTDHQIHDLTEKL